MTKLIKFSTLLLVAALVFAGCKKEEPEDTNYGKAVAGEYVGTFTMVGGGTVAENATLAITRITDDSVSVALNQTIAMMPLNINCKSKITKPLKKDFLIQGQTIVTLPAPFGALPVGVSGTITEAGAADFNIQVQIGAAATDIISVQFAGTKK